MYANIYECLWLRTVISHISPDANYREGLRNDAFYLQFKAIDYSREF
jgi:hypothetical protein